MIAKVSCINIQGQGCDQKMLQPSSLTGRLTQTLPATASSFCWLVIEHTSIWLIALRTREVLKRTPDWQMHDRGWCPEATNKVKKKKIGWAGKKRPAGPCYLRIGSLNMVLMAIYITPLTWIGL